MTDSGRPRVLLADDHRLVGEALAALLAKEFEVVGIVEDGRELVAAARKHRPDVIVTDITMPHLSGIEALAVLRREQIDAPVVILTMHRDVNYVREALDHGARAYVLKHAAASELVDAVRAALSGQTYITPALTGPLLDMMRSGGTADRDPAAELTPRQREILHLLAEGRSAKEIAAALEISTRTVEFHKYQLMDRLGIDTSAGLVHFAIKHGIVEL